MTTLRPPEQCVLVDEREASTIEEAIEMSGGFGPYQLQLLAILGGSLYCGTMWILLVTVFIEDKLLADTELGMDKEHIALSSSLFFFGWCVFTPFLTSLSDRVGRRVVLRWCTIGLAIGTMLQAGSSSIALFMLARVIIGCSVGSGCCLVFLVVTESSPSAWRATISTVLAAGCAVFIVIQSLMAYYMISLSWRLDTLVYGLLPTLAPVLLSRRILESPQYCVASAPIERAQQIIQTIAQVNGVPKPAGITLSPGLSTFVPTDKDGTRTHLTKTAPKTLSVGVGALCSSDRWVTTVVLCVCWFTVTLVYYGLSFIAGNLAGSVYTNSALLALAELPAYIVTYYLLDNKWWGRRRSMSLFLLLAGCTLVLVQITGDKLLSSHSCRRLLIIIRRDRY
jgi:MFS family permease